MSSGNQMVDGLMADEDHDTRYGDSKCDEELDNIEEEYLAEERINNESVN